MGFVDPIYNKIKIDGGQVLLNGNIITISTTTLSIPDDSEAATYNVIVDADGVLKILRDDFYEVTSGIVLTTPSAQEIINSKDKLLLAQVDVHASGSAFAIRDYRRYINTIDNKLELIVEENEITNGSFSSLSAAVNYLNIHGVGYSGSRVIKVRGTVEYDLSSGPLYLPDGVLLEGENYGNIVGDGSGSKVVLVGTSLVGTSLAEFIVPGAQCMIRNLNIECDSGSSCLSIIGSTSAISGLRVEGCSFKNTTANFVITAPALKDCVIKDCYSETKAVTIDSPVLDSSGFFIFTYIADNVVVENNVCDALGKDVFSFVVLGLSLPYGSTTSYASNVWVTGNKFYASGLTGMISGLTGMISGIHITNCNNVFVNENVIELTNATSKMVFMIGVIDLVGYSNNCTINNNRIVYKNDSLTATDIWVGIPDGTNNSYYTGFAIGVNSPIDLVVSASVLGDMTVKDIIIEGNYINTMSIAGIVVGVANGIGSDIVIKNNIIDNSYLVGFGVAVGNTRSSVANTQPVISGVLVDNNFIDNKIEILDYTEYVYIVTVMPVPTSLIVVGGIDWTHRGYYNNVTISNNFLSNANISSGIPHGIVVERANNVHILNNCVKNCGLVSVDVSIKSYAVKCDGINNCFIRDNILDGCSRAIYLQNNNIDGTLLFGENANVEGNYINSTVGTEFIIKLLGISGQAVVDNNIILNNSVKASVIYLLDCTCDRIISYNNIYSYATKTVGYVIYIQDIGGTYKTNISNNILRMDSVIFYCSILLFNSGNAQNIYVEKNIILGNHATSGIVLSSSGQYNYVYLNDNLIVNSNTSPSGNMIYLTGLLSTNVSIRNNFITTLGNGITFAKTFFASILNNVIGCPTGTTYCAIGGSDSDKISIEGNFITNFKKPIYFDNSSYSPVTKSSIEISKNKIINGDVDTRYLIEVLNVTNCDVFIDKNILFYTVNGTNSVVSMVGCSEVVSGKIFITNNDIFSLKDMADCIFVENTENIDGVNICNNSISLTNVTDSVIRVSCDYTHVISSPNISNNNITGTSLKGNGIFVDGIHNDTLVCGNTIVSNETTLISSSEVSMIRLDLVGWFCSNITISNNVLGNKTTQKGVKNGIYVNCPTNSLIISGNTISVFNANSSGYGCGIWLDCTSSYGSIIANNIIKTCCCGMQVVGTCSKTSILNNFIESSMNRPVLYVVSGDKDDLFISGNYFYGSSSAMTYNLVHIDNTGGERALISNNIFKSKHSGSSSKNLLSASANSCYDIINNKFEEGTFSSSAVVLSLGADGNGICAFNNLRKVIKTGTKISTTNAIDYHNWGQTYDVTIPLSNFIAPSDNLGASSWAVRNDESIPFVATATGTNYFVFVATSSSLVQYFSNLSLNFSTDLVPVGSTIENISVSYFYYGMGGSDPVGVSFAWCIQSSYGQAKTFVVSSVSSAAPLPSVEGTNNYALAAPTPVVMTQNLNNIITLYLTDPQVGNWLFKLTGAQASYIL